MTIAYQYDYFGNRVEKSVADPGLIERTNRFVSRSRTALESDGVATCEIRGVRHTAASSRDAIGARGPCLASVLPLLETGQ
jgi:hypothetical protein